MVSAPTVPTQFWVHLVDQRMLWGGAEQEVKALPVGCQVGPACRGGWISSKEIWGFHGVSGGLDLGLQCLPPRKCG